MSGVHYPCATGRCAPGFYQGAPDCQRCRSMERNLGKLLGPALASHAVKPYEQTTHFRLPDLKGKP